MKVLLDFYNEGRAGAAASTPASSWRSSASSSARHSCSAPSSRRVDAAAPAPAPIASATSSWRRVCRSSSGAASPTTSCSIWRRRASCTIRPSSSARRGGCSPIRARRPSPTNFAGQWLSLRRLPDIVPDPFLFPDYGDTLALAFQREAELFFDSIVREDRPTVDLLTANYTFVNERLAQHYGIPNVKGVNFRRVDAGRRQSAPRSAGQGRHPDGDRAAEPDVAGRPRQVGAAEHPRRAAARAAAERAGARGERQPGHQGAHDAGAARAAPRQRRRARRATS